MKRGKSKTAVPRQRSAAFSIYSRSRRLHVLASRSPTAVNSISEMSDRGPINVRSMSIGQTQFPTDKMGAGALAASLSHTGRLRGICAARRSSAQLGAARRSSAQLGAARRSSAQLGTARHSSAHSRFHRAALAISPRSSRDFTAQHSRFHRAARAISPRSTRAFGRVVATALARYARVAVTNTHGNGVKRQRSEPASSLQAFAVFPMGRFARSTVRRRERGYRASAVATAPPQEEITVALRSLLVWRPQRRSCLVSRTVPTMTTTIYGKRLLGGCAARRSSGRPLTSSARGKDMHARRWQAAQSLLATKRLVTDMQGGGGGRARGVRGAGVSVLRRRFTTVSPFHRFTVSETTLERNL